MMHGHKASRHQLPPIEYPPFKDVALVHEYTSALGEQMLVSPWACPKNEMEYAPQDFTHDAVKDHPVPDWADPEDIADVIGGLEARQTFEGPIAFDARGRPLNPRGRTGMTGRGLLGRWGPNHAADLLLTRDHPVTRKLQIVVVQRKDVSNAVKAAKALEESHRMRKASSPGGSLRESGGERGGGNTARGTPLTPPSWLRRRSKEGAGALSPIQSEGSPTSTPFSSPHAPQTPVAPVSAPATPHSPLSANLSEANQASDGSGRISLTRTTSPASGVALGVAASTPQAQRAVRAAEDDPVADGREARPQPANISSRSSHGSPDSSGSQHWKSARIRVFASVGFLGKAPRREAFVDSSSTQTGMWAFPGKLVPRPFNFTFSSPMFKDLKQYQKRGDSAAGVPLSDELAKTLRATFEHEAFAHAHTDHHSSPNLMNSFGSSDPNDEKARAEHRATSAKILKLREQIEQLGNAMIIYSGCTSNVDRLEPQPAQATSPQASHAISGCTLMPPPSYPSSWQMWRTLAPPITRGSRLLPCTCTALMSWAQSSTCKPARTSRRRRGSTSTTC